MNKLLNLPQKFYLTIKKFEDLILNHQKIKVRILKL